MNVLKLKVKQNKMIEGEKGVHYEVHFTAYKEGKKGDINYEEVSLTLKFGSKRNASKYPIKSYVELEFEPTQAVLDDSQQQLED